MDAREKYRRRDRRQSPVCVRGDIRYILNVAAKVRLRPHHHKHRRGAGQFLRILHSYLLEYLRRLFCQCHDIQDMRSFFGRGI